MFFSSNVTKLTNFQSFRMLAILKFLLFNVVLSTTDVATDMLTFFDLLEDNPLWACLTMVWMMMPFLVHTMFFLFKAATGRCKICTSFTEFMRQFYAEAGIHLPFVSSMHNIWRAKRLYDLKFGTEKFNFKDHKEAEKILDEAGRCSQAESNFEAGPQSVTQVVLKYFLPHCKIALQVVIVLSTGQYSSSQIFSLCTSVLSLSWGAARFERNCCAVPSCNQTTPLTDLSTTISLILI